MLRLSNSEISDYQRCKRMHYFGNVLGKGPLEAPNPLKAAEVGTRFHSAMERYYGGESQEDVLAELTAVVDTHEALRPGSDDHKATELVLTMVEGYFDWLAEVGLDHGVEVVAPESTHTRTMPEFDEVQFIGKLDLETVEGLEDFKTTKIPFSQKLPALRRSRQPVHYAWLLEPRKPVTRVRFRVARQSTRSERTSPPYYATEEVPINAAMLRSHEDHLRELVPEILANYERTTPPAPSPGEDCSWRCPFYLLCPMVDNGEDWRYTLREEFRDVDPLARYREADD